MAENKSKTEVKTEVYKTGDQSGVRMEARESLVENHQGKKVKHYRISKGYSQEYMAIQLGISQQRYSELEKEEIVDEEHLIKIAEVLNIGIEWLKDIPIIKGHNTFIQEGTGANFQNSGDATHATTINNPVEEVVKAYQEIISRMQESYKTEIERLTGELKTEKQGREDALKSSVNQVTRLIEYVTGKKE